MCEPVIKRIDPKQRGDKAHGLECSVTHCCRSRNHDVHVEVQRTSYASRFSVSIMWVLGNLIGRFPIGENELGGLSYLESLVFCLYSFIYYSLCSSNKVMSD